MEKIEPVKEIPMSRLVDTYLMHKMHIKINEIIKFLNVARDEIITINKKINEVVEIVNTLIKDKELMFIGRETDMGVYDIIGHSKIQVKMNPHGYHYYLGNKVPFDDGLYLTPDGWFVVKDSIVVNDGGLIFNKYGANITLETKHFLDAFNPITKVVEKIEKKYFGKGCEFQLNKWEMNEEMGGEYWVDQLPLLTFCKHLDNPEDTEGNCRSELCPERYV